MPIQLLSAIPAINVAIRRLGHQCGLVKLTRGSIVVDDNTPIIVGVAELVERIDGSKNSRFSSQIDLAVEVLTQALADCGLDAEHIDVLANLRTMDDCLPTIEQPFGRTPTGRSVELYTLLNGFNMEVEITNYGGIITAIKVPDKDGNLEHTWAVHQLYTTSNFAPSNWFINFYTGGLNHQVEHHIFPHISHVHYSKLAKIVKETAKEFNLPYNEYKTTRKAIIEHFRHLGVLGKNPEIA